MAFIEIDFSIRVLGGGMKNKRKSKNKQDECEEERKRSE